MPMVDEKTPQTSYLDTPHLHHLHKRTNELNSGNNWVAFTLYCLLNLIDKTNSQGVDFGELMKMFFSISKYLKSRYDPKNIIFERIGKNTID